MRKKNMKLVYLIIGLGALLQGYLTGVIAGVLPFMIKEFDLNTTIQGLVSSFIFFGGIIGALSGANFSNHIGRKKAYIFFVVIVAVGALGVSSNSIELILFFRFVLGFGIGCFASLIPIYLAELAPSETRGTVVGLNGLCQSLGFFCAYIVNYVLFSTGNWRLMNLLSFTVIVFLIISSFYIPESPQWLLSMGELKKSRKIALLIYNQEDTLDAPEKEAIIKESEEDINNKQHQDKLEKWMLKPLLLSTFFVVLQKWSGSSSVLFYDPTMLQKAGLHSKIASLATVGIGFILFLFNLIGVQLVDRKGRKALLIIGNILMAIVLLLLGILVKMPNVPGVLLVLLMYVFIGSFGLTWASVPWVIIGEFIPTAFKGKGSSIATGAAWLSDAVLTFIFPVMLPILKISNIFIVFAVLNFLSIFLIKKEFREPKGKTQIQIDFENKKEWKDKHGHKLDTN